MLFAPAVSIALAGNGNPLVMRTLGNHEEGAHGEWVLRRSRPEVGFASVEVTLPWLATAIAGINEGGVAVAMVPRTESYGGGVLAGAVNSRHAPPRDLARAGMPAALRRRRGLRRLVHQAPERGQREPPARGCLGRGGASRGGRHGSPGSSTREGASPSMAPRRPFPP